MQPVQMQYMHEDYGGRGFVVLLVGFIIGAAGALALAYSWGWLVS